MSLLCVLGSSCDDFLSLTPRDTKVVSDIEDYRDIMASYMKFLKTPNMASQESILGVSYETIPFYDTDVAYSLAIYTGESNLNTSSSAYFNRTENAYTQTGKNYLIWENSCTSAWRRYYGFLGPINLIISGIENAEGTNENLRNYVKGEALVWRAYTFYKLLQFYSPYKNNEYGVPVYLTPDEEIGTAMPERKTQKEVFNQIFSDCQEALDLLKVTSTNDWNCAWRSDFIHAMLASVYTWKSLSGAAESTDWANAEQNATSAMQGRNLSNTTDALKRLFNCSDATYTTEVTSDECYIRLVSGEYVPICLYSYAYHENQLLSSGVSDGKVNAQYYKKFSDGDIRKKAWFSADGTYNDKYNIRSGYTKSSGCLMPFRLAEMYLIKAEALVRQGKTSEGATVLSEFCANRYDQSPEIPSSAEALIQLIKEERFKEFYMEGDMVWLDMKRYGETLERTISGNKYKLEENDFRYSFPIPSTEIELNKNMVQNPGWENIIID